MGIEKEPEKVLLVMTVFSNSRELIEKFKTEIQKVYGEIVLNSPTFLFNETSYYEKEMGKDLNLEIVAFKNFITPKDIAKIKVSTNSLEKKLHDIQHSDVKRAINIDPGYITLNKFVLATTKDAGHRIYIDNGIYGEATLSYENKDWKEHSYTYKNYKNKEYQKFLTSLRDFYKENK